MTKTEKAANTISDCFLLKKSRALQNLIGSWAKRNSIWQDCGFKSWIKHYDSPPDPGIPAACLLCLDGSLAQILDGEGSRKLRKEFEGIVKRAGFWWDRMDGATLVFLADDATTSRAYGQLCEWQWTSSLIKPDFALIHESILKYFNKLGVQGLFKLTPRGFEIYLESLFQERGYRTILGPGANDGGIDLRLYSSDLTGDVLTLVQAKRYAPRRAIRLDAVQALTAAVDYEPARSGFFVTTSRFLPSAQKFAERKAPHIRLLTGQDVIDLTGQAARDVEERRSRLAQYDHLAILLKSASGTKLEGQILHASTGYGIKDNGFAICVKSNAVAALLLPVPCNVLKHDGYGQAGYHIPDLRSSTLRKLSGKDMLVAKCMNRRIKGSPCLWGNGNLYTIWNGQPCDFNYCD